MSTSANTRRMWAAGTVSLLVAGAVLVRAQDPGERRFEPMIGHLATPQKIEADDRAVGTLRVPDGFEVRRFAADLENPRMMAVGPDGTVYVTRPQKGDVLALRDTSGDGRADDRRTVVSGIQYVHGITVHEGRLYLAAPKKVLAADLQGEGRVGEFVTLVDDLPDGAQHPNRTMAFGPDGQLYVSVGSSCNACDETNDEHATLLRLSADGSERSVYAKGLRNTVGFGWHPETGDLWGMDHGSDWRGDDIPPEELNRIEEGRHYGWPFCYGDRQVDPFIPAGPEGQSREGFCKGSEPPVLTYQAHAAPMAMVFYAASQFPTAYHGDAFVAFRGSWNRHVPTGYKVTRLRFDDGEPRRFEDFLSGFLSEDATEQFGRPVGLAIARDGALLVSEDSNGTIYRVAYTGKQTTEAR